MQDNTSAVPRPLGHQDSFTQSLPLRFMKTILVTSFKLLPRMVLHEAIPARSVNLLMENMNSTAASR